MNNLNLKEILKYKLKNMKSSYFCLKNIKIIFKDNKAIVKCEFEMYGIRHYEIPSEEMDKDQMSLIELLKGSFNNVETDLYAISFEIPNYEEYIEKIKKDIIFTYSKKWAIQIIKINNSSYYDEEIGIDLEFIKDIKIETTTFGNKEEAIVKYHLLKNNYESWDYVDIKLIKVLEE